MIDSALPLFPGFSLGDPIVRLGFVGANLELYASDQVVFVDTPLPFAQGDEAFFDLTSDEAGVFQTFWVNELGRFLPSDVIPTVPDSLAI